MDARRSSWRLAAVAALIVAGGTGGSRADDQVSLDRCRIVMDAGQPTFVRYAIDELAGYLRYVTEGPNAEVVVGAVPAGGMSAVIAIGPKVAGEVLGAAVQTEGLGEEGYVLKSGRVGGKTFIAVAGAGARGTMAGVYGLMKLVRTEGGAPFIPGPLDRRSKPAFATRGMHFNGWPFKYPYSFRRWQEADWQRYLDILAYQGVNLFYLWPFMEIMPVPLSAEDQAYLEECRRLIDYAHEKHGMEVWIMQCTNRVAKDRCGVADPKARPYWRPTQEDLRPGDPKSFEAIMASREVLYRMLSNVDGVCNIDSDPGWCSDCPLDDYVNVLKGCRSLLDRYNVHGKQAKLMSWMWAGWGQKAEKFFDTADQERTVGLMKRTLTGDWGLVAGRFDFLPICRRAGMMDRTVLLPYGMIENEPSYPWTNVGLEGIGKSWEQELPANPDLTGVIGNVQTPLLQLPHVYYLTSLLWNTDYRKTSEKDALLQLGTDLYPEHAQLMANSYLGLKESDPGRVAFWANRLEELSRNNQLGRLGIIGRKLFPDSSSVARGLAMQLHLHEAQERLMQTLTATTPQADRFRLVRDCIDAYLAWDLENGWHEFWGWTNIPLVPVSVDPRYPAMTLTLAKCLRDKAGVESFCGEIGRALSGKYDAKILQTGCVGPLQNTLTAILGNRAIWAKATASVTPDATRYPAGAANDGRLDTCYWPGALVKDNAEWLQLTWDSPETIRKVVVRFLKHPSMAGRTIHLQREAAPGQWEDVATTVIPADAAGSHSVATFELAAPVTLDRIRIVNLLDVFEVEVN